MKSILNQASTLLFGAFDQTALLTGISDIIVVRWDSGHYQTTPFLVCFGHKSSTSIRKQVRVQVNNKIIENASFTIDEYGYLHPMRPKKEFIEKLNL